MTQARAGDLERVGVKAGRHGARTCDVGHAAV
jgi:hypothetical protein